MIDDLLVTSEDLDFREWAEGAAFWKAKVHDASAFRDEVFADLFPDPTIRLPELPWLKTQGKFAFRPGEVTIWAGPNYSGKSLIVGQQALSLMKAGHKVFIASFEMACGATLSRMIRQGTQTGTPTEAAVDHGLEWMRGKLFLLDHKGSIDTEQVIGSIYYAAKELGVEHVMIDNVMKVVRGEDDLNGQKDFVNRVCQAAHDLRIHVHLVHHIRKTQGSPGSAHLSRYDLRGSGTIADQVDNILIVQRLDMSKDDEAENKFTNILRVDKARNGSWDGSIALWFAPASMQFCEHGTRELLPFFREPTWTGN